MSAPPVLSVGDEPPRLQKPRSRPAATGKGGRFAVLNGFVDFTLRDLDRAELAVWLILYRDTKADGLVRTAQTDLARRAGVAVRTVRRAVGKLHDRGLLVVVNRGGLRRGVSTYRVRPLTKGA